jgi:geranyl-CoA carboxylase alpha subunit
MHTTLIDDWAAQGEALLQRPQPDVTAWLIAAAAHALPLPVAGAGVPSIAPRRNAALARWQLRLQCQGETREMTVQPAGDTVTVMLAGAPPQAVRLLRRADHQLRIELGGVQRSLVCHEIGGQLHLVWQGASFVFTEPSPYPSQDAASDARRVLAPVAGTVAQLAVQPGDRVAEGQPLVCVEAMKMEMWQHAGAAGTVTAVHVAARDSVAAGSLLVELTLDSKHPTNPTTLTTPRADA